MPKRDISNTRFTLAILLSVAIWLGGAYLWMLIIAPACNAQAAYCTPVSCISNAGCIPPCFCAKQQGDAYGTCMGSGHE